MKLKSSFILKIVKIIPIISLILIPPILFIMGTPITMWLATIPMKIITNDACLNSHNVFCGLGEFAVLTFAFNLLLSLIITSTIGLLYARKSTTRMKIFIVIALLVYHIIIASIYYISFTSK